MEMNLNSVIGILTAIVGVVIFLKAYYMRDNFLLRLKFSAIASIITASGVIYAGL